MQHADCIFSPKLKSLTQQDILHKHGIVVKVCINADNVQPVGSLYGWLLAYIHMGWLLVYAHLSNNNANRDVARICPDHSP